MKVIEILSTISLQAIGHGRAFLLNSLVKSAFPAALLLQSTCFFHTGGFFAPIDGGLYNGFQIAFLNPNLAITTDKIFQACHDYKPNVIVCG